VTVSILAGIGGFASAQPRNSGSSLRSGWSV